MSEAIDVTIPYECPDCGSAALMHIAPGLWPGLFECTNEECGLCDYCEHTNERHTEEREDFNGHTGLVYVCEDCLQDIPADSADPAADRADALAAMQVDMAREQ